MPPIRLVVNALFSFRAESGKNFLRTFANETANRLSSNGNKSKRAILTQKPEKRAHGAAPVRFKGGVAFDQKAGVVVRGFHQGALRAGVGDAESRQAGLHGADQIACAAHLQIDLGDSEAVFGLAHDLKPLPRGFAKVARVHEQAA